MERKSSVFEQRTHGLRIFPQRGPMVPLSPLSLSLSPSERRREEEREGDQICSPPLLAPAAGGRVMIIRTTVVEL